LSPVAVAGSTTFEVTFDPSAGGTRVATLNIANDDSDENPYNFSINGTGALPEMDVTGNSVSIVDGDAAPAAADFTAFGTTDPAGGVITRSFTIQNTGAGPLSLTGTPRVSVSGIHANDFTVTLQPASPVAAAGTTTFEVTFDPAAGGIGWLRASFSVR